MQLKGRILDFKTGEAIDFANILIEELNAGIIGDEQGNFEFKSLCPGKYHFVASHVGCDTREYFLEINKDTIIVLYLDHSVHLLEEVSVQANKEPKTTQSQSTLSAEAISEKSNESLATLLEEISGVSIIRNGRGISKPVVHGLYGNRLAIMNNGISQSGQQWGVDHSPEIDPLAANEISVVKGVSALQYFGNSLGGIILVEPGVIKYEPHLHGRASYVFESNGRGHGLNLRLQQSYNKLAWRLIGTLKKRGDFNTPDYYLNNTGVEEGNLSFQLNYKISERTKHELYLSTFNSQLGVLRGSHIGNLTDLDGALDREEPFFTEKQFSYEIEAPRQTVGHHLAKSLTTYQLNESQQITMTLAGQINLRKEFDVRRSGRSDIPALSLRQFNGFGELKYNALFGNVRLQSGIQYNRTDNENIPETGILPLIPDYISTETGLFTTLTWFLDGWTFEGGFRYDREIRNVAAISFTTPRRILRYNNTYQNYGASFGTKYDLSKAITLFYNVGLANRNPEVNELYSNGLHQGVSGIEEGDPDLKVERAVKQTLSMQWNHQDKIFFEPLVYLQYFGNYMFLDPQDELRLTIRGAFPVFKYQQSDARIYGADFRLIYWMTKRLNTSIKYSYIKGDDLSDNIPLVNIPSNNGRIDVAYEFPKALGFEIVKLEFNGTYVFKQRNLNRDQDFVETPNDYYLVGARLSAEKQVGSGRFKMFISGENLLNRKYRDYLNRQRYFADDLGRNIIVGANYTF